MIDYVTNESEKHSFNLKTELNTLERFITVMISNVFRKMLEIESRLLHLDNAEIYQEIRIQSRSAEMHKHLEEKIHDCKCKSNKFRWWHPVKWSWGVLAFIFSIIGFVITKTANLTTILANVVKIF